MGMNDAFRLRKSYRNGGIFGLLVFGGMLAATIYLALTDRNVVLGILHGSFWSFWICLSVWMLLAYYRESLTIQNGTVVWRGVRRIRVMNLSELVEVRWKRTGSGAIVLRSHSHKMTIDLVNFIPGQRPAIIRLVGTSTPQSTQQGWEQFCYVIAMPLLRRLGNCPPQESDKVFLIGLPVWGMIGITGFVWFEAVKRNLPRPSWWGWTGLMLWLAVLLFDIYRAGRRMWRPERQDIENAVKDWERYASSQ
jgi:hypothetical protein